MKPIIIAIALGAFLFPVSGLPKKAKKQFDPLHFELPKLPKPMIPESCLFQKSGVACCVYEEKNCKVFLCRGGVGVRWQITDVQCEKPKPKRDFDKSKI